MGGSALPKARWANQAHVTGLAGDALRELCVVPCFYRVSRMLNAGAFAIQRSTFHTHGPRCKHPFVIRGEDCRTVANEAPTASDVLHSLSARRLSTPRSPFLGRRCTVHAPSGDTTGLESATHRVFKARSNLLRGIRGIPRRDNEDTGHAIGDGSASTCVRRRDAFNAKIVYDWTHHTLV